MSGMKYFYNPDSYRFNITADFYVPVGEIGIDDNELERMAVGRWVVALDEMQKEYEKPFCRARHVLKYKGKTNQILKYWRCL